MNKLYKTLVYGNQVSLSVMDTTDIVNKAIKIHNLSGRTAKLFGALLTCGVYMAGCLKSDKGAVSLTVKAADGDGAVSVSCDKDLHVRGYCDGSCENTLKGGQLTVIKEDGFFRPFNGFCEIKTDDVSEILMQYFHISEQIPTAVSVGVNIDGEGNCTAAGGVVMQLLPGTDDANRDRAEEVMQNFVDAADVIESIGADEIIKRYFKDDIDVKGLYLYRPDYICNCSRRKIARVLISVGKDECLAIVKERGNVSVHCHYCNTDYVFEEKDVHKLFDDE